MQNVEATILSQYANSPSICQLIANMNAYLDPRANIDAFYNLVWNVDTAEGYGLDVWGRIVGVGRVLKIEPSAFFGFQGPTGASGLPFRQAPFFHGGSLTSNFTLLDGPYRALILAKALTNISNATIPSINQILINIFGVNGPLPVAGNCYVADNEDMTMTYVFGASLDPVQTAIVYQSGIFPRPCGVLANVEIISGDLVDDGGVLTLTDSTGWPSSAPGTAGLPWSNGGVVSIAPGAVFDVSSPPLFFGATTATALLALNLGINLPTTSPTSGSNQLWNNGNEVWIA